MKTRMILAAAVLGIAGAAQAGTIIQPVAISTNIPGDGWNLNWVIDQSGIWPNYVSDVSDFDSIVASSEHYFGGWNYAWFTYSSNVPTDAYVDLDLGASYDIESMALWENQGASNILGGMNAFSIRIGNDPTFTTSTLLGSFNGQNYVNNPLAQVFSFAPGSGRYVRLEIQSFHNLNGNVGIGEIAFERSVVPAPAAAALLGMGGMMSLRRRRR